MTPGRISAFSLVEITIALGIVAFGCVAIFGLLGASASNSRLSSQETAISMMSRQIVSSIRKQPFSTVEADLLGQSKDFYFDVDGNPLLSASDALYRCSVTGTEDASTTSSLAAGGKRVNLIKMQLVFNWPLQSSQPNTSLIHASVSR